MNEYMILRLPHLSEKSINLKEKENKIAFKVHPDANKVQIKEAIQKVFKVTVLDVKTINCRGKVKRRGRFEGKRADWKKAIIKLKKDDKISYFEGT